MGGTQGPGLAWGVGGWVARMFDCPALPQGLSFITFICYVVSSASAFLTVPLLEFLLAVYFLFADAMQLNDKWQGLCWPMMVRIRGPKRKGLAVP